MVKVKAQAIRRRSSGNSMSFRIIETITAVVVARTRTITITMTMTLYPDY